MKKNLRRCAGCRIINHKDRLIRLIKAHDQWVLAPCHAQARSLYVCRDPDCWAKARKQRRWGQLDVLTPR